MGRPLADEPLSRTGIWLTRLILLLIVVAVLAGVWFFVLGN